MWQRVREALKTINEAVRGRMGMTERETGLWRGIEDITWRERCDGAELGYTII